MSLDARQDAEQAGWVFSDAFWDTFVDRYWERQPLRVEKAFTAPFATAEQIFQVLVAVGDCYRRGEPPMPSVKVVTANAVMTADVGGNLPTADDRSLTGYLDRVTAVAGQREFGVVLNDVQAHSPELWDRARRFLRDLFVRVGLPVSQAGVELILSTYDRTPLGVHVDPIGTFMFILGGHKRMLVWPQQVFRARPDLKWTQHYEEVREQATVLEGTPGDVLYWPSHYWHIGESVSEPALSVTLSAYQRSTPQQHALDRLGPLLSERLATQGRVTSYPFTADLPTVLHEGAAAIRACSADVRFERALKVAWLNRVTATGFLRLPPALPERPVGPDTIVCGDPAFPILWLGPEEEEEYTCSANGHSFSVPADPRLPRLLERLNSGAALRIDVLLADFTAESGPGGPLEISADALRMLLAKLCSVRALTRTSGS